MTFPFDIYGDELAAVGVYVALFAALVAAAVRRRRALGRILAEGEDAGAESAPPVSVVVYANSGDSDALERWLPLLMRQDYEPGFEVIVVNTDESETVMDTLLRMSLDFPELRVTFIPRSSANVSKKKLAVTLGVKAATHGVVLVTSARCRPSGALWLKSMGRWFADPSVRMVIGYSHPDYAADRTLGWRYRASDEVSEASRYLASAWRGRVYRANGDNLAFRKEAFFANGGFASSLNCKYGDDDIFASELAAAGGVRVELSPDSILTEDRADPRRQFGIDKRHRSFTQRRVASRQPVVALLSGCAYYGFTLLSVALLAYSAWLFLAGGDALKAGAMAGFSAVLYLAYTLIHILAHRRLSAVLQAPRLWFSLPLFRFVRPMVNAVYGFGVNRAGNYTWE